MKKRQTASVLANTAPAVNPVSVITLSPQTWQPFLETVGVVSADQGTDLSIQASGVVKHIYVKSGQMVKKVRC